MDNVIPFRRRSSHPVFSKPFESADVNPDSRDRIARCIGQLSGRSDIALSKPARILESRRVEEPGTVVANPTGKRSFDLIVSPNFVQWLTGREELDIDIAHAQDMADCFISAFGAIYGRLQRSNPKANGSYIESYWDDEYRKSPLLRLPYRAAGTIALKSCGSGALELDYQQYSPHIAGLANPLEPQEFKELHDCFKIGIGEQGEFGCD
jgi:hypothetical protein